MEMLSFEKFTDFCVCSTEFIAEILCERPDNASFTYKSDGSEVTPFDLLIEDKLRSRILEDFSDHCIKGEEREVYNPSAKFSWIIDPIDGTFGFSRGVPQFGTLIGFCENDLPKYGFLRMPDFSNSWIAGNGSLTLHNGNRVKPESHVTWQNSLILTTDLNTIITSPIEKIWKNALKQGPTARTWGDCLGYYLLCLGKAELMADTNLKPHDILPLVPILHGCGLEVHQIDCDDYSNVVACKKGVFEQIM